jgi:hypothetical protein
MEEFEGNVDESPKAPGASDLKYVDVAQRASAFMPQWWGTGIE